MKPWQFSIRSLLLVTSAFALWLWMFLSIAGKSPISEPGRLFLAFSMTLCWYVFAVVIRGVLSRFEIGWPAAVLSAGIALIALLFGLGMLNEQFGGLLRLGPGVR